jgi:tryptophanase
MYERTIPVEDFAMYISRNCFVNIDGLILLNYKNINCIYYNCHQICLYPVEGFGVYRALRQSDIDALYDSYVAIALNEYTYEMNDSGKITIKPNSKSIPQWIFDIVAISIELHKP